jgi:hypothetical protein
LRTIIGLKAGFILQSTDLFHESVLDVIHH